MSSTFEGTIRAKDIPNIQDPNLYIQAGINPKNGLPVKATSSVECDLKMNIKLQLRLMDEQDAINRYRLSYHPFDVTSQEVERLLYYKFQLCIFYCKELEEFFIMPYALDRGLDFYGRFKMVHPIPITEDDTPENKRLKAYLSTMKFKVLYDIPAGDLEGEPWDYCVLVSDYSKQMNNGSGIARYIVNDGLLDMMAECIPYMRTNLINSTGVHAVRVGSADEAASIDYTAQTVKQHALAGNPYVSMTGALDFQELTGNSMASSQDYMAAFQSLNNYRLSLYGLGDGSFYQKKAQMLNAEVGMLNRGTSNAQLDDGLMLRQHAADLCNYLWGTKMIWEISETALNGDSNMDGIIGDRSDRANSSAVTAAEVNDDERSV